MKHFRLATIYFDEIFFLKLVLFIAFTVFEQGLRKSRRGAKQGFLESRASSYYLNFQGIRKIKSTMAGSRLQKNKPHKTRFASKSSRHIHKLSESAAKISKGSQHNMSKGAKAARMQRSKMVREQKRAALLAEKRALTGSTSPPRIIVLFPLSSNVQLTKLKQVLMSAIASDEPCIFNGTDTMQIDKSDNGKTEAITDVLCSSTCKLRSIFLEAPHGDLQTCLEMAKVADIIAFVASADGYSNGVVHNRYIDLIGSQCLSMLRALGLPSTIGLITDLPMDQRKKHDAKKQCISSLTNEFPEDCKILPADTKDDFQKLVRHLGELRLSVPQWRNQRPFLMAQQVEISTSEQDSGRSTLLLSGYVRARSLSVNQLVHVPGAGDFQLDQIDILEDPFPLNQLKKSKVDSMQLDDNSQSQKILRSLLPNTLEQELIVVENVPDPLAGEQTWPTKEELAEADKNTKQKKMRKRTLPRGVSDYQAAWIVEETDDENDTGDESEHEDDMELCKEEQRDNCHEESNNLEDASVAGDHASVSFSLRDYDEETQTDFMADDDNFNQEEVQAEIQRLKEAHAQDEEFPDEVDTPMDVPARQRFARYRGLKSFRTSSWDPKESLPEEYARIFAFDNFARTHKHALAKAKEIDSGKLDGCASVGAYVQLHIKGVPIDIVTKLLHGYRNRPVIAFGLFQHETKMSVLHFSVKKHDSFKDPIKSKEPLMFHVGFRQFSARPIFSSDDINGDKHKLERFLHPGHFSVASVFAPICFPPLPVIVFKDMGESAGNRLAAVGSLRSVNPDRIILKKVVLTGYPQRVSKVKALVRFMFHNPEDARWFKPVELWTKYGRHGRIKEPVGTHGAMKCIFDGVVQQRDTVCLSLYKRAYPKWTEQHF
ncbi:uncharacterized protein LOC131066561 isoform X1 [Cryptomeria japonica]|uniref:uncharacterized protein LOC131066561 isoform X1 n=2 Tax=Cryptomeria japonica TaxID=3369 RepID=UPI0027DA3D45|nr:uncharacterized protein LOC131066561 isoform X1 [Cryptomeria japonica]